MTNSKTSFVDDLNGAIRENPVAAGLIGAGALWMFLGGARIPAFATKLRAAGTGAGSSAVNAAARAATGASNFGQQTVDALKTTGNSVADATATVRDTVSEGYTAGSDAVSRTLSDAAATATRFATESGSEYTAALRTNLSDTLEKQPLLLGAIGLAIGAGIASAFPATNFEKDMVGENGIALRETLEGMASGTAELAKTRAGEVLQAVKDEASAQGLVPDLETLKGVGEKVKTVAGAAQDAMKKRLPSG